MSHIILVQNDVYVYMLFGCLSYEQLISHTSEKGGNVFLCFPPTLHYAWCYSLCVVLSFVLRKGLASLRYAQCPQMAQAQQAAMRAAQQAMAQDSDAVYPPRVLRLL